MSEVLIEARDLTVQFAKRRGLEAVFSRRPTRVKAVDGVNLSLQVGEILGLVGETGSGKTTFAKTVLRLVDIAEGTIHFRGQNISKISENKLRPIRHQMQMVFQDPLSSLNPRQRIAEAIATPLRVQRSIRARDIDHKVDEILNRVGLSVAFRDRYPHELSGGQLQRAAVGRALILEPALIVADEAVSKLDVSVRAQILNLFKDIMRGGNMSMLFITHDLHVARYLCDRIGVMYFGKLVEFAPTQALFDKPAHPYTQALFSTLSSSRDSGTSNLAGEAFNPVADDPGGCRFLKRCPLAQPQCAKRHPPPEEIAPDHCVECYEWRRSLDQSIKASY